MPTKFPDNTSQIWNVRGLEATTDVTRIEWDFENENEFMWLAQLVMLCRMYSSDIELHMPYLPYARQDKDLSNKATFALHTFAKLINDLEFSKVTCIDPHSQIAGKLIKNFAASYPAEIVEQIYKLVGADVVCFPDGGAKDKYTRFFSLPWVWAAKSRDAFTGQIKSYTLHAELPLKGKTVLIVDDICDGGATFIALATALKESAGVKNIHLYVTHGLFSRGIGALRKAGIKRVFTREGERFKLTSKEVQNDSRNSL